MCVVFWLFLFFCLGYERLLLCIECLNFFRAETAEQRPRQEMVAGATESKLVNISIVAVSKLKRPRPHQLVSAGARLSSDHDQQLLKAGSEEELRSL